MKYIMINPTKLILSLSVLFLLSGCDWNDKNEETEETTETEAQCLLNAGGYTAIEVGGRMWLDKNLGATEVADTPTNTAAYGNLYQWGRAADGHEARNSASLDEPHADTITPDVAQDWYSLFITEFQDPIFPENSNMDWTLPTIDSDGSQRVALWKSPANDSNLNQVCPCGYVVPSEAEFSDLNTTEIAALKLPYVGFRDSYGVQNYPYGRYWLSETPVSYDRATSLAISDSELSIQYYNYRNYGFAVRCIKPQ